MAVDLDIRRRRAAFRASHRGTKEMDLMMGRYADARLAGMDEAALAHFEALIEEPDPLLQRWLLDATADVDAGLRSIDPRHAGFPQARADSMMDVATEPHASHGQTSHSQTLTGAPEGFDALLIAQEAQRIATAAPGRMVLHVVRDDRRLEALEAALQFFAPDLKVVAFPAWDTVPYDRVGPNPEIVARRITALAKLTIGARKEPGVVLTTVNAILQRLPPRESLRRALRPLAPGQRIDMNGLIERLSQSGFVRTGTVMEPGEFAVRGGILDIFPPGRINPVRLDFFGDTLESIKSFDAETQRTNRIVQKLVLMPISEMAFGEGGAALFRSALCRAVRRRRDHRRSALSGDQRRPALSGPGALAAAVPPEARDAVRLCRARRRQLRSCRRRGAAPALRADHRALPGARRLPGESRSSAPRPTSPCRPT